MRTPLYGRTAVLSPTVGTAPAPLAQFQDVAPLPRWRARAVALAAALMLGSLSWDAHALALGRVQVLSALGEPLRVEVDVPQVSAEEVQSLKTAVGTPELFRALGVDYNQALAGTSVSLQRRANGSYFLRVSTDRPINEPFLDVVLEASWATGRIVRDFTLLLDPPALRPAQTLAPQLSSAQAPRTVPVPAPAAQAAASATPATAPAQTQTQTQTQTPVGVAPATRRAPAAGGAALGTPPGAAGTAPAAASVTVQPGDTAGRIATQYRPPAISLDQMLVALLRANPAAFDGSNINRLRAGSVLSLPDAQQAGATAPAEAKQIMVAQSRDFNEFRRRLAQGVSETPLVDSPSRSAAGRVQTEVQDRAPSAATPDRLTLSKGAVQGRGASLEEERIALERAAQDNAARLAELNKNIAELNRLNAATAAANGTALGTPANAASPAAAGTAVATAANAAPAGTAATTTMTDAPAAAAGTPPAPAGTTASKATTTATAASPASAAPTITAAATMPAAAPPESMASDLIEQFTRNPLVPAAAGGIVALLLGLGFWRLRRRRKTTQVDSSFLESRLQPDSFFGASGGQRIDTAEGQQTSASSMVYSPSQLDAAGDVDPVAEADVYLAYGRDLQAEEILKEALRSAPQRVAIHTKLLEIYARRRDVHAFELIAAEAHALTQGHGPEWQHICHMGQDLDPQNPLYEQRRGRGDAGGGGRLHTAAAVVGTQYVTTDEADEAVELQGSAADNLDLDLDIDLDFIRQHTGGGLGAAIAPHGAAVADDVAVAEPARAQASATIEEVDRIERIEGVMLDFDDEPFGGVATPAASIDPARIPALADSTEIDLPSLDLDMTAMSATPDTDLRQGPTELVTQPLPTELLPSLDDEPSTSVMLPLDQALNFDMSDLSLDLDPTVDARNAADAGNFDTLLPSTLSSDSLTAQDEDPLGTKLALAQEFEAIGDSEGARSLAEEVVAEATGELQSRAQRFLADLG